MAAKPRVRNTFYMDQTVSLSIIFIFINASQYTNLHLEKEVSHSFEDLGIGVFSHESPKPGVSTMTMLGPQTEKFVLKSLMI